MPYAKIDSEKRIIEWSYDKLTGLDVEFSNGEYVDEVCTNGVEDFIIENGIAIYSPLEREPKLDEILNALLGVV